MRIWLWTAAAFLATAVSAQELPFVLTSPQYAGQACFSVPWPGSFWSVADPTADDLVVAGANCASATIRRFGDLADSDLVVTCNWQPGDTAAACSARGEGSEPASSYRDPTDPPPPPPPPPPDVEWNEGTSSLTWTAPTQMEDGSPLTGAVSYRIEQGQPWVLLGTTVATSYQITGLTAGTYDWRVYAIVNGLASVPSNTATKTIVAPDGPPEPDPVCGAVPPPGESRTVQCPVEGSWEQTRWYVSAPYPTCWAPTSWEPDVAPAGACYEPPPEPLVQAVPNVPGVSHSLIFGISSLGRRQSTVLGFVPIGAACEGPVVYSYRGQDYRRFDQSLAIWWASSPREAAAVACE